MLIVIFSVMLYHYIKITIFENIVQSLTLEAKNISAMNENESLEYKNSNFDLIKIVLNDDNLTRPEFVSTKDINATYLTLYYPYQNRLLVLTKNTSEYSLIVDQILVDILIINATAIFLILFYALFLSRMLLAPLRSFCLKLGQLNERFLQEVETDELPVEFKPLGDGVNRLIGRILTSAVDNIFDNKEIAAAYVRTYKVERNMYLTCGFCTCAI